MDELIAWLIILLAISIVSAYGITNVFIKLYKKDIGVRGAVRWVLFVLSSFFVLIATVSIFLTSLVYIRGAILKSAGLSGIALGAIMFVGLFTLIVAWMFTISCIDWDFCELMEREGGEASVEESLSPQKESSESDKFNLFLLVPFGVLAFIFWYIIQGF